MAYSCNPCGESPPQLWANTCSGAGDGDGTLTYMHGVQSAVHEGSWQHVAATYDGATGLTHSPCGKYRLPPSPIALITSVRCAHPRAQIRRCDDEPPHRRRRRGDRGRPERGDPLPDQRLQPSARLPLCCTPALPSVGVSIGVERERQQNDSTLADG